MDLGMIRSKFIQTHLRRALNADNESVTCRAAQEFRRYYEWFAHSMPEPDRESISHQLRLLEDSCRNNQRQPFIESTHP